MARTSRGALLLMTLGLGCASAACTSILGDFSTGGSSKDAGSGPDSSSGGGVIRDGAADHQDGSMIDDDAALDAGVEAEAAPPPPPPPPPGRPGSDITSGGLTSISINYKMQSALGEAPAGANMVSKSTNYALHGGVITGTQ
jgi:hypothetical protein